MMGDELRSWELGRGQMGDPRKRHLDRPIMHHFEEYLADQQDDGNAYYWSEKRRIVKLIVTDLAGSAPSSTRRLCLPAFG